MFDEFALVMVVVGDMARSIEFYRDVLATLAERGVKPVHTGEESFGKLAIIPDPDGYGIQICEPKSGGY